MSPFRLLDSALIYTYSVKFLLKADVYLKIYKIILESEKMFDFSKKNFCQFAVKIRNLEKKSRKSLDSSVFRKQKHARKHDWCIIN